jgi:hypothetical protein
MAKAPVVLEKGEPPKSFEDRPMHDAVKATEPVMATTEKIDLTTLNHRVFAVDHEKREKLSDLHDAAQKAVAAAFGKQVK